MKLTIEKRILTGLFALLSISILTNASYSFVDKGDGLQAPVLPAECSAIQAPEGTSPMFRAYAVGVQVYRWNGAIWNFVAPIANLYADPGFNGKVGTHYAGPTWESKSGSKVIAQRVDGCTPDPTAIPWLLLESTSSEGPGIFGNVSHIQRVNTTGGLAPSVSGSTVGEEKGVPYTAEYYFYINQDRLTGELR